MIKKLISITILVGFVMVGGYLCTCASSQIPSIAFAKEHPCCNGIPNCPMKDCKEEGMMSLLPLFTSKNQSGN